MRWTGAGRGPNTRLWVRIPIIIFWHKVYNKSRCRLARPNQLSYRQQHTATSHGSAESARLLSRHSLSARGACLRFGRAVPLRWLVVCGVACLFAYLFAHITWTRSHVDVLRDEGFFVCTMAEQQKCLISPFRGVGTATATMLSQVPRGW